MGRNGGDIVPAGMVTIALRHAEAKRLDELDHEVAVAVVAVSGQRLVLNCKQKKLSPRIQKSQSSKNM